MLQINYYGLTFEEGCKDCACNATGSLSLQCREDGQCECKFGVGGEHCDQCEPGYFGINESGCKGLDVFELLLELVFRKLSEVSYIS